MFHHPGQKDEELSYSFFLQIITILDQILRTLLYFKTMQVAPCHGRSSAQPPTLVFYQLDTPSSLSTPFSVEHHSYQLVLTLPTERWVPKAQLALAVILKRLAVNNSLVKQDLKD